jgi:DNA modification methylase
MQVVDQRVTDNYSLYCADAAEVLPGLPTDSIHLSVFSPPFQSLYVYSDTERDLGNCASSEEFWEHFSFIIRELLRVTVPGRHCCVHVSQIATTLVNHGVIGLQDFRGETIRAFTAGGFIYHGEVCIDKNPQAQAIRTHAKGLLFNQLRKDSSWSRPALADYVVVFRKPGINPIPVKPGMTNDEWIEWAHPVWYNIREANTLNGREARGEEDERHICPLQLPVIERCVQLWSNEGETVLSPFAGIGSEGYVSVGLNRRFIGVELKPEYYHVAVRNLEKVPVLRVPPAVPVPEPVDAAWIEDL